MAHVKGAPDIVYHEHLIYLDALRESGETNMFGAGYYLEHRYLNINKQDAAVILKYWMDTFEERSKEDA